MKIAILGSGQRAIESASYFNQLGAQVRVFKFSKSWGGALARVEPCDLELLDVNWSLLVNPSSIELLGSDATQVAVTTSHDYLQYLQKVGAKLEEQGLVKKGQVKRVHKRFLNPGASLENKSRLADLFRVVYKIDADEQIEKQREENSEVFAKLGEDVVNSLKDSIESFEDFDLVIDTRGPFQVKNGMGAAGVETLNEEALISSSDVFYAKDIVEGLSQFDPKSNKVTLVGTGEFNLLAVNHLVERFIENKNLKIQLITDESVPFERVSKKSYSKMIEGFAKLVDIDKKEYEQLADEYQGKIHKWRDLDAHVKAKTPKPTEPTSRLFIYNGAVVSSVDRLLDQEGIFLTIEGSELLGTGDQLKTLSTSTLFIDNGFHENESILRGLNKSVRAPGVLYPEEPGYFSMNSLGENNFLSETFRAISDIEKEIMKYFSKA